MSDRPLNVLIVCTGNSARSILAESLINYWGRGKFRGYSAGSQPRGSIHPIALELLRQMKMPTEGLRSKSWDEFAAADAPQMDFIFTVCDNAANETCPAYPGQAMRAHWGVADPALETGSQTDQWLAFREAFRELESRVRIFTSLPLESLDRASLQQRLDDIGKSRAGEVA